MKLAAAVLGAVLSLSACGECGEAPAASAPQEGGQTVSGGASGGGGGGTIPLNPRDKKKEEGPLAAPKPEQAAVTAPENAPGTAAQQIKQTSERSSTPDKLSVVASVRPADFDRVVLKGKRPVLVLYGAASCRPCAQVEFQLATLASGYAGKVEFARLDLDQEGAVELLPSGLRRLPLPAFAFYQDGSPLNIRQGLPVAADASTHLKNWLKRVIEGRDVRL